MTAAGEPDFRRLFESAPVALLVMDPDLTIRQASDAFLAVTTTRREVILGRSVLAVFPDDPHEPGTAGGGDWAASLRRVADGLVADVMPVQKYAAAGEGVRYWAPVNVPVLDESGRLAWIVCRADEVPPDVRELRGDAGEDDIPAGGGWRYLAERNRELRAVLDNLDLAVLGCAHDGRAILVNPAAERLVDAVGEPAGTGEAGRTGMAFLDVGGRRVGVEQDPMARVLRGESVRDAEVCVRTEGSPPRTFLAHGVPVHGAGRLAAVVAFHDVTLLTRAKQLKDCEVAVSELLGKPGPSELILASAVDLVGVMLGWAGSEFWSTDAVGEVIRRRSHWQPQGRAVAGLDRIGGLLAGEGLAGRAWLSRTPVWVTDSAPIRSPPPRRTGARCVPHSPCRFPAAHRSSAY
ncbi:PAS domain-containing protein [Actinoplanes sp. NPDC023801]|uniref:PAS domain-containing protein n=1 Tax=Actinoplanes sp. NPDC023801 TaxID=3154595 RepID=UPI0033D2F458